MQQIRLEAASRDLTLAAWQCGIPALSGSFRDVGACMHAAVHSAMRVAVQDSQGRQQMELSPPPLLQLTPPGPHLS